MPKSKTASAVKEIEQYTHIDKDRVNNPQVELVMPETNNVVSGVRHIYCLYRRYTNLSAANY